MLKTFQSYFGGVILDFLEVFVFIVSRGLFGKGAPRTDPYMVIISHCHDPYDPLFHSSCPWWMLFFFVWLAGKMFVSKGGGSSRCLCQRVVVPVQRSIYMCQPTF